MPKRRVKRHSVTQPLDKPYRYIPLTRNQIAVVDASDFEWLDQWNWCAAWSDFTKSFYAQRYRGVSMAREILGCEKGEDAEHWNGNTLDNRRQNLRKATRQQNCQNRKMRSDSKCGFKGIRWHKADSNWQVRIQHQGKRLHGGSFHTAEEAARAYDTIAQRLYGQFARLNFPQAASQ